MARIVPAVEATHDEDLLRIGCPNREVGPLDPSALQRMGSQLFIEAKMASLVKEKKIVLRQEGLII
jgi:hypothetical protein